MLMIFCSGDILQMDFPLPMAIREPLTRPGMACMQPRQLPVLAELTLKQNSRTASKAGMAVMMDRLCTHLLLTAWVMANGSRQQIGVRQAASALLDDLT